MKEKRRALSALARKRQQTRWHGYSNFGDYHHGAYECMHVSPYSKAACNVDSEIMVLLQDLTSDENIRSGVDDETRRLGYTPRLPTNRNLIRLLKDHFDVELQDVFATNLFPFIKQGHFGRAIPRRDLVRAAVEFALPQIRVVRPKLVICLGLPTFNAIREACGQKPVQPLAEAIRSAFTFEDVRTWCQAHTGGQGQAMRNRGRHRVTGDWKRMKMDVELGS